MGVKGLWQLLEGASRPTEVEELEGQVLAVDVSIWLHQIVRAMRDQRGDLVRNAHIHAMLARICRLIHHRIKPVFVFDGVAPTLKKQTLAERNKRRVDNDDRLQSRKQQLLLHAAKDAAITGEELSDEPGSHAELFENSSNNLSTTARCEQSFVDCLSDEGDSTHSEDEADVLISLDDIRQLIEARQENHCDVQRSEEADTIHDNYSDRYINMNSSRIFTPLFESLSLEEQYHIVIEAREAFKRRTQRSGSSLLSSESYDDFSLQQLDKIMQKDQLNRRLNEIRQKLLKTMTVDGAQAHKVVSEDRTIYTLRSLDDQQPDPIEKKPTQSVSLGTVLQHEFETREEHASSTYDSDALAETSSKLGTNQLDVDVKPSFTSVSRLDGTVMEYCFHKESKYFKSDHAESNWSNESSCSDIIEELDMSWLDEAFDAANHQSMRKRYSKKSTEDYFDNVLSDKPTFKSSFVEEPELSENSNQQFNEVNIRWSKPLFQRKQREACGSFGTNIFGNAQMKRGKKMDNEKDKSLRKRTGVSSAQLEQPRLSSGRKTKSGTVASPSPSTTSHFSHRKLQSKEDRRGNDDIKGKQLYSKSTSQSREKVREVGATFLQRSILSSDDSENDTSDNEEDKRQPSLQPKHRNTARALSQSRKIIVAAATLKPKKRLSTEELKKVDENPILITDSSDSECEVMPQFKSQNQEVSLANQGKDSFSKVLLVPRRDTIRLMGEDGKIQQYQENCHEIGLKKLEHCTTGTTSETEHTKKFNDHDDEYQFSVESGQKSTPVIQTINVNDSFESNPVDSQKSCNHTNESYFQGGQAVVSDHHFDSEFQTSDRRHGSGHFDKHDIFTIKAVSSISPTQPILCETALTSKLKSIQYDLVHNEDVNSNREIEGLLNPDERNNSPILDNLIASPIEEVVMDEPSAYNKIRNTVSFSDRQVQNLQMQKKEEQFSLEKSFNKSGELHGLKEKGELRAAVRRAARAVGSVTPDMIADVQQLLRLFGCPYVVAPQEAESQCAQLEQQGLVSGIITDDSDIFLFGGKRVYRHVCSQKKNMELYLEDDFTKLLGLDRDILIDLAQLLGSDYAPGLSGVGPITALEIICEFYGPDTLFAFKDWMQNPNSSPASLRSVNRIKQQHVLPQSFPNPLVRKGYLKPVVEYDDTPFVWTAIDMEGLREFISEKLGWDRHRADDYIAPLVNPSLSQQQTTVQTSILHFFDRLPSKSVTNNTCSNKNSVKQHQPVFRSGRLRKATLLLMKRQGLQVPDGINPSPSNKKYKGPSQEIHGNIDQDKPAINGMVAIEDENLEAEAFRLYCDSQWFETAAKYNIHSLREIQNKLCSMWQCCPQDVREKWKNTAEQHKSITIGHNHGSAKATTASNLFTKKNSPAFLSWLKENREFIRDEYKELSPSELLHVSKRKWASLFKVDKSVQEELDIQKQDLLNESMQQISQGNKSGTDAVRFPPNSNSNSNVCSFVKHDHHEYNSERLIQPMKRAKRSHEENISEFFDQATSLYKHDPVIFPPTFILHINRGPVLVLWVTIVAKFQGYVWPTALTLGRAVADFFSASKGKRLGINTNSRSGSDLTLETDDHASIMGHSVPLKKDASGILQAISRGKVILPTNVMSFLKKRFKDQLAVASAWLWSLVKLSPNSFWLAEHAYEVYKRIRPDVPEDASGWGRAAEFSSRICSQEYKHLQDINKRTIDTTQIPNQN